MNQDMKNMILEASIKIINDQGYEKLSMRKIADAIGYSATTLYIYFENKAQIAEAIGMQIFEDIMGDVTQILEIHQTESIENKLRFSFRQFILTMTRKPEMGLALIRTGSSAMFKTGSETNSGENLLQNLLKDGLKEGILTSDNPNTSWMLLTSLIGFGMNAIENELYTSQKWQSLVNDYVDLLIYGLITKEGHSHEI